MSRRAIANFCGIPAALFLVLIGLVHTVVNVAGVGRAIERGDIAPRLGDSVLMNAAFSGLAMSVLGVLVLFAVPGLRSGNRQAANLAATIGIFIGLFGAAAYFWVPTRPAVLIFLLFGALLAVPILISRREFSEPSR